MPNPRQIDFREWHWRFQALPEAIVEETRYYRHLKEAPWSRYLFPPSTFIPYGNRLLKKLKYDNSEAGLRLWGFTSSEGERIYRSRQTGMKVVAVMGDLGAVTPLVYSFPNTIAFYPDCLWWTPFLRESWVLFEEAAEFGLGEDCCYVRAALGGFSKKAYFPRPDLNVATVGATCDDMSAVISEAEFLGYPMHYFELPHRDDYHSNSKALKSFLMGQYRKLSRKLEEITGTDFSEKNFKITIAKVNRLRELIAETKKLTATHTPNPLGGLEMMLVEFSALSYYGDLDECLEVMKDIYQTAKARVDAEIGYEKQYLRLVWVTPPADPLLINYAEDLGGRIVGSEYLINQTTPIFSSQGDPFEILAESHLSATLMGSSVYRANLILELARRTGAEGVIISGIFGSSHCPYETQPIVSALRMEGIPVLTFDVAAPGKIKMQSQIHNRMSAFMESLRRRSRSYAR